MDYLVSTRETSKTSFEESIEFKLKKKLCLTFLVCILLADCQIFQVNSNIQLIKRTSATAVFDSDELSRLFQKLEPFHRLEPDAYSDPPEFIRNRHFVPEVHHVTTKDGYVLTMHRIINPAVPFRLRSKLKPVLLQHGLFTSSFNFIISSDRNRDRPQFNIEDLTRTHPKGPLYEPAPPFSWQGMLESFNDMTLAKLGLTQTSEQMFAPQTSESLAFELSNQGYDVWMGNSRGSTFSLNHTRYDYRHDWRYWDFSFHEIALFDLPAQIDYVLSLRRKRSLAYIGHSQGNLAMFILQSFQPGWANKVKPFIALAPVAFVPNIYFGAARLLIKAITSFISTTRLNQILKGQIFPNDPATGKALDLVCVPKWTTPICDLALTLLLGDNFKRANHSLTPVIAHHIPEGTSVLNVLHFGQMVESGQFRSFDFGPKENLRRYGTPFNPFYPIRNINSTDIAFVSGRTDTLATIGNIAITRKMLRVPLLDDYVVPEFFWGHADYMYANGAGLLANAHMIGLIDRYRLVDT